MYCWPAWKNSRAHSALATSLPHGTASSHMSMGHGGRPSRAALLKVAPWEVGGGGRGTRAGFERMILRLEARRPLLPG
jgi:hypothetical protein